MILMDASKELNLKNPAYKKAMQSYIWHAHILDLDKGDTTTNLFLSKKNQIVKSEITAKQSGVFAGVMEAEWFLKKLGIKITKKKKDGSRIKKGDLVMSLSGRVDEMMSGERTLLNLLQRMSGIATATDQLVRKLPKSIKLLSTRKTFWGELDKRAVHIGGGCTHRLNLNDAVLIKDNHIALSDNPRKDLERAFKEANKVRFVEVELDSVSHVKDFVKIYSSFKSVKNAVVMLDNFKPSDIKKAVAILKAVNVFIEVSGGITEKNIKKYAIKGIDAVSSGAITNKAGVVDLSLNIIKS